MPRPIHALSPKPLPQATPTAPSIANPPAEGRQCRPLGDEILFCHPGKDKAVIGTMAATSDPHSDPDADDEPFVHAGKSGNQAVVEA